MPSTGMTAESPTQQMIEKIEIEKCTGCGECLEYCPAPGALVQYKS